MVAKHSQSQYRCTGCTKSFSKAELLRRHARSHLSIKPYQCTQTLCGKGFARSDALLRHHRLVHHSTLKPTRCRTTSVTQRITSERQPPTRQQPARTDSRSPCVVPVQVPVSPPSPSSTTSSETQLPSPPSRFLPNPTPDYSYSKPIQASYNPAVVSAALAEPIYSRGYYQERSYENQVYAPFVAEYSRSGDLTSYEFLYNTFTPQGEFSIVSPSSTGNSVASFNTATSWTLSSPSTACSFPSFPVDRNYVTQARLYSEANTPRSYIHTYTSSTTDTEGSKTFSFVLK